MNKNKDASLYRAFKSRGLKSLKTNTALTTNAEENRSKDSLNSSVNKDSIIDFNTGSGNSNNTQNSKYVNKKSAGIKGIRDRTDLKPIFPKVIEETHSEGYSSDEGSKKKIEFHIISIIGGSRFNICRR